MADLFIDSTTGNDANSGVDFDNALATIKYAWENSWPSPSDYKWIRPNHSEIPTSDITPITGGIISDFKKMIAWPKPEFSITSAMLFPGLNMIMAVVPASLTESGMIGRKVIAPNGGEYIITQVQDASTCYIDRIYTGNMVSGPAGACTILADPSYDIAQAIDDSSTTIKKADWNANNPARPVIDFNDTNYQVNFSSANFWWVQGLEFKDSSDAEGIVRVYPSAGEVFLGCLFNQSASNSPLFVSYQAYVLLEKCIFVGSAAGVSQRGIVNGRNGAGGGHLVIRESAIYRLGDYGIESYGNLFLDNVNSGIELANGNNDIFAAGFISGKDVKFNNIDIHVDSGGRQASFENYYKDLGLNRTFYSGGYYYNVPVVSVGPNKKLSDDIIRIVPTISGTEFIPEMAHCIFEDEWNDVPIGTYDIGYWIFNESGLTLNPNSARENIWIEVEYVTSRTATGAHSHTMAKKYSTQMNIATAADSDDWTHLTILSIPVAYLSKVRMKIYFSKYTAGNAVFIDPKESQN